jgi:hypothetical protein
MPEPQELDKIIARIRALLDKTTNNGATEAEALSAAEKARELMAKYQVTLTDAEIRKSKIILETFDRSQALQTTAADYCVKGIENLCGVRIWFHTRTERSLFGEEHRVRLLAILGAKADMEFAHWLYEMIDEAIDHEADNFRRTFGYKSSQSKARSLSSFQAGMATRINHRLIDMANQAKNIKSTSGTALVVVKDEMLNQAMSDMNIHLRRLNIAKSTSDGNAYAAGIDEGEKVNLNRPLKQHKEDRISA